MDTKTYICKNCGKPIPMGGTYCTNCKIDVFEVTEKPKGHKEHPVPLYKNDDKNDIPLLQQLTADVSKIKKYVFFFVVLAVISLAIGFIIGIIVCVDAL